MEKSQKMYYKGFHCLLPLFNLLDTVKDAFGQYCSATHPEGEERLRLYELSINLAWSQSPNVPRQEQERQVAALKENRAGYLTILGSVVGAYGDAEEWLKTEGGKPENLQYKEMFAGQIDEGGLAARKLQGDLREYNK